MLIELWERLRGYDKWVKTEAMVKTVNAFKKESVDGDGGTHRWNEMVRLVGWLDQQGNERKSLIRVRQHSWKAEVLHEGKVPIVFNPFNSQEYYIRELARIQLRRGLWLSMVLMVILFASLLGMIVHGNVP